MNDRNTDNTSPAASQAAPAAGQPAPQAHKTVEDHIVEVLKTVFDPEIPVNIYDLGLIYKIDYHADKQSVDIDMTLTAPGCPMADYIMDDVRQKLLAIQGISEANVNIVFEPQWNESMMDDEAKAELALL